MSSESAPKANGTSILWQRLDVPGHDFAVLDVEPAGAVIRGMAIFHDEAGPSALSYTVHCDRDWRTTEAQVRGWTGSRTVELLVARESAGRWTLNGAAWPAATLTPLVQRYRRDTGAEYFYEADLPNEQPFAGILRVAPSGWVVDYAGLWQAHGPIDHA